MCPTRAASPCAEVFGVASSYHRAALGVQHRHRTAPGTRAPKMAPVARALLGAVLGALGAQKQPEKATSVSQIGHCRWATLRGRNKTRLRVAAPAARPAVANVGGAKTRSWSWASQM